MKFQTGSVEVKAGENINLHFENQDSAPHNVAIYSEEGGDYVTNWLKESKEAKEGKSTDPAKPPSAFGDDDEHVGPGEANFGKEPDGE